MYNAMLQTSQTHKSKEQFISLLYYFNTSFQHIDRCHCHNNLTSIAYLLDIWSVYFLKFHSSIAAQSCAPPNKGRAAEEWSFPNPPARWRSAQLVFNQRSGLTPAPRCRGECYGAITRKRIDPKYDYAEQREHPNPALNQREIAWPTASTLYRLRQCWREQRKCHVPRHQEDHQFPHPHNSARGT